MSLSKEVGVHAYLEERDKDTDAETRSDLLGIIDEAVDAGARLELACELLGLADRAVQRWREAERR